MKQNTMLWISFLLTSMCLPGSALAERAADRSEENVRSFTLSVPDPSTTQYMLSLDVADGHHLISTLFMDDGVPVMFGRSTHGGFRCAKVGRYARAKQAERDFDYLVEGMDAEFALETRTDTHAVMVITMSLSKEEMPDIYSPACGVPTETQVHTFSERVTAPLSGEIVNFTLGDTSYQMRLRELPKEEKMSAL